MDIKPKEKFIVKKELNNYNINYDIDNSLLKPIFSSKEKNKIELNNDMNPNNYNVTYKNNTNIIEDKSNFYFSNQLNGAGRGFGNLNISNTIHFGSSSRNDRDEWKQYKEGIIIDRFEFIDTNIINPTHVAMDDLPRGGISTRKQPNEENKKITFDYN